MADSMVRTIALPGKTSLRFSACAAVIAGGLGLAACGDTDQAQVKNLKDQVQVAYGNKEFAKALSLAEKALPLARKAEGDNRRVPLPKGRKRSRSAARS